MAGQGQPATRCDDDCAMLCLPTAAPTHAAGAAALAASGDTAWRGGAALCFDASLPPTLCPPAPLPVPCALQGGSKGKEKGNGRIIVSTLEWKECV